MREILVRDGELVRAGQPLIVVGDVRNDAELSLLHDQLRRGAHPQRTRLGGSGARGRRSRRRPICADAPGASEHLARETALFDARRRTLDEQIASLEDADRAMRRRRRRR